MSSRPDCIFEIHQLWPWGFSRVYSNWCCSCSFEPEIIEIGQSSHKMYSNNILNIQESTTILSACTKKSGNVLNTPRTYEPFTKKSYIYTYIYIHDFWSEWFVFLNESEVICLYTVKRCQVLLFIFCTQLIDFKYCCCFLLPDS